MILLQEEELWLLVLDLVGLFLVAEETTEEALIAVEAIEFKMLKLYKDILLHFHRPVENISQRIYWCGHTKRSFISEIQTLLSTIQM